MARRITARHHFFKGVLELYRSRVRARPVHPRGLHYFIVSKLDENEREMPVRGGTRPYSNQLKDYKTLCEDVANARVLGLIPFDWVLDNKNPEIIKMPDPSKIGWEFSAYTGDMGTIPELSYTKMDSFNEFIKECHISAWTWRGKFMHQNYHIVLAIEKTAYNEDLKPLCERYGADYVPFSGQPSVTRVAEACQHARERDLPIMILYASDLDVAGMVMPEAFLKRVKEIYPHEQHILKHILLKREQAEQYSLPSSFEPESKNYNPTLVQRFVDTTGSDIMIELDALDTNVLVNLLKAELERYSNIQQDREEYYKMNEKNDQIAKDLTTDLDLSDFEQEYEEIREAFENVHKYIDGLNEMLETEFGDDLQSLQEKADDLEERMKDYIKEIISENTPDDNEEEEEEEEDE